MIRQLDPLLSLPATDVPRAVAFYTGVLGLEPVVEAPEVGFYIFRFPEGDGVIGVHQHPGPLPPPDLNGIWCWVRVGSLEDMVARLTAAGVTMLDEASELGPGRHQAFRDSEGNVLRLFEPIDRVERAIVIEAPAEAVFAAITTPTAIERWFSAIDNVRFEGRLGGAVAFIDPVFGPVQGVIDQWNPPREVQVRFTHNWPTTLQYRLTPEGAGTKLTVIQTGFDPIRDRDFGIPALIDNLEAALAHLAGAVA